MECDFIEEGADRHNIALASWEGETSNATLHVTHKNCKPIPSIVDGGSGINIISRKLYDEWNLPKMEEAPFSIKLADQSRVSPLGLVKNVPVRIAGVRFLAAFVLMNLPPHSSSYSILLGRPWLKAAALMHDWKNKTLMLQSRDGAVKVDLKDGRIRPVIPRGSEPSSSASTATHTSVDSQIPSDLSSDYVMNWVEALATIDCLIMSLEKPLKEEPRMILARPQVTQPLPESPEEMLEIFKAEELREEQGEEELLHLCYLAEVESPEEKILRKKEAKDKHNVPKKKESKGVITEILTDRELRAKLQEEAEKEPIPWRDVPQYFKDYIVDEVVIVMPQAVRPSQA